MTELVDLVNEHGTTVLRGVPRGEERRRDGLYLPIVVAVILDCDGRALVQRRSLAKDVDPGVIDHVCGAMQSGEDPVRAAVREAREETGIEVNDLRVVARGVNAYGRYQHLLVGESDREPDLSFVDPLEVEWVRYMRPTDLREQEVRGALVFGREFFKSLDAAAGFRERAKGAQTT